MEDVTQHPMWAEQERIEREMSSRGVHRFMREARAAREEGEASKAGSVRFVLSTVIEPTAKAIQAFIDDAKPVRPVAGTLSSASSPTRRPTCWRT
jgi:hypothetical protein